MFIGGRQMVRIAVISARVIVVSFVVGFWSFVLSFLNLNTYYRLSTVWKVSAVVFVISVLTMFLCEGLMTESQKEDVSTR